MLHRKNKNLRVVEEPVDPTDKIIDKIITELNSEDHSLEEIEQEVQGHKRKRRRKIVGITLSIITVIVAVYLFVHLQTYTETSLINGYKSTGSATNTYVQFQKGVLKYSRDGIAFLNQKGEEQWNQPYQIKSPLIDIAEKSAAIADKGGNDIMVFDEDGVRGEIHTTLPIEKISVSEQGIVGTILKNESSPIIICYDTAGNILVEHKSSVRGAGYPIDIALSADGEVLLVSYLSMEGGKITSKVIHYNFGEAGESETDHQVAAKEYEDSIMPSAFFMDRTTSVVIGDNRLVIYKGLDKPKERASIELKKEVKSAFHSDKYIGLILKNQGKSGYEMRLYSSQGRQVMTKNFTGDYDNVKMCGNQIVMYDGKKCSIYTKTGVHKFEGELKNQILEIFPVWGVNKYVVMNADGMEIVRFVK